METSINIDEMADPVYAPAKLKIEEASKDYFRKLLPIMEKNESFSTSAFCAGKYCRNTVLLSRSVIEDAVKSDFTDERSDQLFCPHCQKHNGEGRSLTYWRENCPTIFQEGKTRTDVSRFHQETWKKVREWAMQKDETRPSLYVYGDTGTCKSRMMFHALGCYLVPVSKTFRVIKGGCLRDAFIDAYGKQFDKDKARRSFKEELIALDCLVFDDFGQDELTENMQADLWSILDARFSAGKATVFLSNLPQQNIRDRYDTKMFSIDSLIRRIEEFCVLVEAQKPPAPKKKGK